MSMNNSKETMNTLIEQGKALVEKGNRRHIIIRNRDGEKIAEMSLTIAAGIGFVAMFSPWGWPLAIMGTIAGVASRLRVEIVHDVQDEDELIQMERAQDNLTSSGRKRKDPIHDEEGYTLEDEA